MSITTNAGAVMFRSDPGISDMGRVRRDEAGHGAVVGRILKPQTDGRFGYVKVTLYKKGSRKGFPKKVQHAVLEAFRGPRPSKHHEAHHKGRKDDNRLTMLSWQPRRINRGRMKVRGAKRSLNTRQVRAIRREWRTNRTVTQTTLARKYGVSRTVITNVVNGRTYRGKAYVG